MKAKMIVATAVLVTASAIGFGIVSPTAAQPSPTDKRAASAGRHHCRVKVMTSTSRTAFSSECVGAIGVTPWKMR